MVVSNIDDLELSKGGNLSRSNEERQLAASRLGQALRRIGSAERARQACFGSNAALPMSWERRTCPSGSLYRRRISPRPHGEPTPSGLSEER